MNAKLLVLGAAATVLVASCASQPPSPPLPTVSHVDLPRYMGNWYVIAHMPFWLENGKVGTFDQYHARPDGKIDNRFFFRKGSLDAPLEHWTGIATVTNTQTNSEWSVHYNWPPSTAPYLIIDLDKNYQWTVVGYPSRKLGWIMSKKPTMDERTYQMILQRVKAQGYDISKFEKVPQLPTPVNS